MDDIKAIDIMNYPVQCKVMDYDFNKFQEWRQMAETTFKPMFPPGRFPVTDEQYSPQLHQSRFRKAALPAPDRSPFGELAWQGGAADDKHHAVCNPLPHLDENT